MSATAEETRVTMPAHERLAELEAVEQAARVRLAEEEAGVTDADRRVRSAEAPIRAYHEAVGRGEPEDPRQLRELEKELVAARRGTVERVEQIPMGGGGPGTGQNYDLRVIAVDEAAVARRDGARQALEDATAAVDEFISHHLGNLAAERAPIAAAIQREETETRQAVNRALANGARERATWAMWCRRARREALLATIPAPALALAKDCPGEGVIPMPECFWR